MSKTYLTRTKKLIQSLLKRFLEQAFNLQLQNNVTKELTPPYLIIGNHQNNWDGFIMSIYNNEQISFVISDEQYRNPLVRRLLNYIAAIPTIKARIDISTIRRMLQAKKEQRIIGLFPEGNRTWDGNTQYIYFSTAKLIKLLKLPVVNTEFRGGHLAHPRWAKFRRKGTIIINNNLLFSPAEIENLTVEQIYDKLCSALAHDEYSWQRKQMLVYKGKRLAERLEYLLFACPNCQAIDQMQSSDHIFTCNSCGYTVEYTENGFFKPLTEKLFFDNPSDWNKWQLEYLQNLLSSSTEKGRRLFRDFQIILKKVAVNGSMKKDTTGEISVDSQNVYYRTLKNPELAIPIAKLDGLNLQIKNQLDFYYENQLYRFSFEKSHASPFKWLSILEFLLKQAKSQKAGEQ